jgi:hypothetical protein
MMDYPELPAILDLRGLTAEERARRMDFWKGRKLTVQGRSFHKVDREEELLRKRLQREQDKLKEERRATRLKQLRENY